MNTTKLSKGHTSYWNGISTFLIGTSEDYHLRTNIIVETDEDMGLSDNEKLRISEIWQEPKEGIITFKFYGSDEEFDLSDYEDLYEQVYTYLKENAV